MTFARLKNAAAEPWNWLTYWGNYPGTHSSALKSITPANVGTLRAQWTFQFGGGRVETSPMVVDGLMFVTGRSTMPMRWTRARAAASGTTAARCRRSPATAPS